jgi:glutamate racemase
MKIGIFDSGLGGLVITKAVDQKLPVYDLMYLGDTLNMPYGNKTKEQIYAYTKRGLEYLFKNDCKLVIVACNSASADALRRIQQEFIPTQWPDRKALGVLIPSAEVAVEKGRHIGIICTQATADSRAFDREIGKLSRAKVLHRPTPELVENIENGDLKKAQANLETYLSDLTDKNIDTLILGCTHYPILKDSIAKIVGDNVHIVSQDEVVPSKLSVYLKKHQQINEMISKDSRREFYVTKITTTNQELARKFFGVNTTLKVAKI